MHKLVKLAVAAGAIALLTGCPKATTVKGRVLIGVGALGSAAISTGDNLTAGDTYYVDDGASITVTYDNGKTCTFNGPTEFIPGSDGSVCEKKDEKKDEKKEERKDQQQQQDNAQQQQGQASTSGINGPPVPGSAGIGAPAVVPTAVPDYYRGGGGGGGSAIGGPQVISTAAVNYTPNHLLATTTNLVEAIVGIIAVKKAGDKLDDNRNDKPVSP